MPMKKILFTTTTLILSSIAFASDEKPKVSFCNAEECELQGTVTESLQETRAKLSEWAHANQTVMGNYDTLAALLSQAYHKEKSMTAQEIQEVCMGVEFAAEKHQLQTRKNPEKTPYISHPIGVANYLIDTGEVRDPSIIIGALLHDTVEDTQTTWEEIEKRFGVRVANYVREMTDDKSLDKEARKRSQIVAASQKSKGAAQIKLADKLYNLNDLSHQPPKDWSQLRIDQYYEWAHSVIHRLPKVNDKLFQAVNDVINAHWENEQDSETD
jgi:guanosine-3',5'-bis(diphosphate) 3'-pyrophosphohydrolase